ncbi:MAG: ParB/RepB/Spo0J family partition protein [Gemmatimonadales bacterium]|jgi:ParB family chromosome partitioning protein|nr:MAG: ParB/RepB/Spo0J family partition protein [Gemmatimonadales bacterium]
MKKDRLGRGLGALLGEYATSEASAAEEGEVTRVATKDIVPNPLQPRQDFQEDELRELVDSIRENGLLQPLVVRPSPTAPGRFELVAGERRFRSLQALGWEDAPVMVREVDDETLLVLALVENLQREALNPIEEAEGFQALAERFSLTQEEIAKAVGKDRSTVANTLRLLKLPHSVRRMVAGNELSPGHARALLGLDDAVRMADLARQASKEGWSVREMERRVKAARGRRDGPTPPSPRAPDPVVKALEAALQERLATRVVIRGGGKKGKGVIEIPFLGTEDFERIFAIVTGVEATEVLG